MLTIIFGVLVIVALFGVPILFKPRKPLFKRLAGDTVEITNVGYGTSEKLPQFFLVGFLLMGVVMSAGERDLTRISTDAAILLTLILTSLLSLLWLRSRHKSYRFDLTEAKAEKLICQFGKSRRVREYVLQKPLTVVTLKDYRGEGNTYYWTQWNVAGGKPIKIEHDTDEERRRFRDWLRQNDFSVTQG